MAGTQVPHPVFITDEDGDYVGANGQAVSIAGKQTFTRPNDTTPYSTGDLIGNDTDAVDVAALAFTGATISGAGGSGYVEKLIINKTGTGVLQVRAHFLKTAHAVTNGDNGALVLTGIDWDNYIGFMDVSMTDAAGGGIMGMALNGPSYSLSAGDTVYVLLEALQAYTPTAQEVFTVKVGFARFS